MSYLSPKEVASIERALALLIEQTNRLREATILETDAGVKFKYEEQIRVNELKINEYKSQLANIHYLHGNSGGQFILKKFDEINLEIEEMGEQDLVNVNRELERERFFQQFDILTKPGQPKFQFYYISSCPTQMPHSFSEWAILEIAFKELEESLSSGILYHRKGDTNRVQIRELPIGRNLDKSKKAFKKFFAKFFNFKSHVTFDQYIKTGLPSLNYEYVAFVFDYDGSKWKPFHKTYFEWLTNTFQSTSENMPTFLFFFVLTRRRLHQKDGKEYFIDPLVKDLEDLSKNEATTHISPLRPVSVIDLERWFRELGERNPARIEEVISFLVKGLKPEDEKLYLEKQQFNMDDIERLQGLIYEWYLGMDN